MRRLLSLTLLAFLAAGAIAADKPRLLSGFEEFDRFPAEAAGYKRGEVVEYGNARSMYSIGYSRYDNEVKSAVTLYIKPKTPDIPAQLKAEEATIINSHAGAQVVSRDSIVIMQGDKSFHATLVRFEYDEMFANTRQRVSSLVVVSFQPDATFKVRATAPAAQTAEAESAMLKLLESVRWE